MGRLQAGCLFYCVPCIYSKAASAGTFGGRCRAQGHHRRDQVKEVAHFCRNPKVPLSPWGWRQRDSPKL
jgi:hypothetical protein